MLLYHEGYHRGFQRSGIWLSMRHEGENISIKLFYILWKKFKNLYFSFKPPSDELEKQNIIHFVWSQFIFKTQSISHWQSPFLQSPLSSLSTRFWPKHNFFQTKSQSNNTRFSELRPCSSPLRRAVHTWLLSPLGLMDCSHTPIPRESSLRRSQGKLGVSC